MVTVRGAIEASINGIGSYVELLTCLEMDGFVHGMTQFQPTEPAQLGTRDGDAPDPGHAETSRRPVDEMRREPDSL